MTNILTIDVEEWFHALLVRPSRWSEHASCLLAGMETLLALLDAHDVRATFFVLAPLARDYPELIRQLAANGHEIGTHGMSHQAIYNMTPAEFQAELCDSIALLEDVTGESVLGHRAPFFSISADCAWAFDVLAEAGLRYDSSVFPVHNSRYGIPNAQRIPHCLANGLHEFPLATWRLLRMNLPTGGGFYGRFFPAPLLAAGIRQLNRAGHPAVIYFHPWEFDPAHPVGPGEVSRLYRFTHYYRLGATKRTLDYLLKRFRFRPMRDALPQAS